MDDATIRIGGPILKDRWHFYFGYEYLRSFDNSRRTNYDPADKARLIAAGLLKPFFPPAIPFIEATPFYIFRTDLQIEEHNRLTARFNHADARYRGPHQEG
jgi:hypothetical protein